MPENDAELDAIAAELEAAGLIEEYVNADGKAAMRFTPDVDQVARQMAMSSQDDAQGTAQRVLERC